MASSSNHNAQNTNQFSEVTFSFITSAKLDRSNYMIWKSQVLSSIRGNRLEGFINGDTPAPEQFFSRRGNDGSTQQIANDAYLNWRAQDQQLLSWLLSSFSEGIISLVLNLDSSLAVWQPIEKKFGVQSQTKVLQLKYEMSLLRKDSSSVEEILH